MPRLINAADLPFEVLRLVAFMFQAEPDAGPASLAPKNALRIAGHPEVAADIGVGSGQPCHSVDVL